MKKKLLLICATICAILVVTVLLPSLLVVMWPASSERAAAPGLVELQVQEDEIPVKVYLEDKKQIVTMPLEKYVRGVVAAEMPVTFELEAMKAQAIAARTYIVRRLKLGVQTPEGADVSDDHTTGQQYSSDEKLEQRWGLIDYPKNLSKVNEAVNATKGQVAMYDGQPIEALFFSTSSGATENSEDYWGKEVPYLRSVPSPWDKQSDKYTATTEIPLADIRDKLGLTALPAGSGLTSLIQPLEKTATDHFKKVKVGDKTFTGPELRSLLGLRSTLFTWKVDGDKIAFTTIGFGHGVGMSQYGANGMAQEGKTAQEIVQYYYKGIALDDVRSVLPTA